MLATCLDRKVWFNQGYFKLFPNLYIVLVANSQKCRKSSALKIGYNLLNELPEDTKPRILSQKMTPESILDGLWPKAKKGKEGVIRAVSSGLFYAEELATLLDKQARNAGMLSLLVDMYDSQEVWSYRTKSRGVEELRNVYCNLLAGASPEYLRLSMPYEEIGGGMLARTIFVYQKSPRHRVAFPELTQAEIDSKAKLVHDLIEIQQLSGVMDITASARKWYKDWYEKQDPEGYRMDIAPYLHKKETLILKIAQLLSVAEGDTLLIDEVQCKMALALLEENEKFLPYVMGELLSSPQGYKNQQVLNCIRDINMLGRQATRAALMRKLIHNMDAEELMKTLETLQHANLVEAVTEHGKERGRMYFRIVTNTDE
jgi:hypothetical protein